MSVHTAIEDEQQPGPAQCWCCSATDDPDRLVHLGNHPEVAVCTRCAHALSKWAWEIEDRSRSGIAVRARDGVRSVRKSVIRHGWHQNRLVGRGLRWLGRFTP